MKRALVILFVLFSMASFAEGPVVPKEVKANFTQKFELAEDVSWEVREGLFEASFYLDDELTLALYTAKGEWLETATSIYSEDIPEKILDVLAQKYDSYNIESAYIVIDNGNQSFYSTIVETEDGRYQLKMLMTGKILEIKKLVAADDNQVAEDEEEE